MFEFIKGEPIRIVYDVEHVDTPLTGSEPVVMGIKRAGANGFPKAGAAALSITGTISQDRTEIIFEGPSTGLQPGVYLFDAFITIGAVPVGLRGGQIRIIANNAEPV